MPALLRFILILVCTSLLLYCTGLVAYALVHTFGALALLGILLVLSGSLAALLLLAKDR